MLRQGFSLHELCLRAGVDESAVRKWWQKCQTPNIGNVEALLNVLGYRLGIAKNGDDTNGKA